MADSPGLAGQCTTAQLVAGVGHDGDDISHVFYIPSGIVGGSTLPFFATCNIAFSDLLVFGKLLVQQATCLGGGKLKYIEIHPHRHVFFHSSWQERNSIGAEIAKVLVFFFYS